MVKPEAHIVEENIVEDDDSKTLNAVDGDNFMKLADPVFDNMYDYDMHYSTTFENDMSRMYEWLADTGSTNHITKEHDLFSTYETTCDAFVLGVGGNRTKIEGCKTIILAARYGTHIRSLHLKRINHIPSNKYYNWLLGVVVDWTNVSSGTGHGMTDCYVLLY